MATRLTFRWTTPATTPPRPAIPNTLPTAPAALTLSPSPSLPSASHSQLYSLLGCTNILPASSTLCPKSDLSDLDINPTISDYQKIISQLTTDNCAILDTESRLCTSNFGTQKDGPIWYNPLNLPAGEPGTEPLSNEPRTPFAEFGAATYTLELFLGFTSVITPAPFSAQNAAATQNGLLGAVVSGAASGATTGTVAPSVAAGGGSSGSTGSNTGPATPSKTSGVLNPNLPSRIWSFAIIAAVLCTVTLL
jgi:hypothetical protein